MKKLLLVLAMMVVMGCDKPAQETSTTLSPVALAQVTVVQPPAPTPKPRSWKDDFSFVSPHTAEDVEHWRELMESEDSKAALESEPVRPFITAGSKITVKMVLDFWEVEYINCSCIRYDLTSRIWQGCRGAVRHEGHIYLVDHYEMNSNMSGCAF